MFLHHQVLSAAVTLVAVMLDLEEVLAVGSKKTFQYVANDLSLRPTVTDRIARVKQLSSERY